MTFVQSRYITHSSKNIQPSFLSLPREIRDLIYEFSLSAPPKLVPYDHQSGGKPPGLALISVSKAIREEALPILFGTNTCYVTTRAARFAMAIVERRKLGLSCDTSAPQLNNAGATIFHKYGHLFHSVVLTFRQRFYARRPACDDLCAALPEGIFMSQIIALMPNLQSLVLHVGSCHYESRRCCRISMLGQIFDVHRLSSPLVQNCGGAFAAYADEGGGRSDQEMA